MEDLIAKHHPFKKHLWPGGKKLPKLVYQPPEEEPESKRNHIKPRRTLKKPQSSRKQRRISNYFKRTVPASSTNEQVLELLTEVSSHVAKLREENRELRHLIKRTKFRRHSRRSSFHAVICPPKKKALLSHIGCQTDPPENTVQLSNCISFTDSTLNSFLTFTSSVGSDTNGGRRASSLQLPCRQPICSSALRPTFKQDRLFSTSTREHINLSCYTRTQHTCPQLG